MDKRIIFVATVVLVCFIAESSAIRWKDCGSKEATVTGAFVQGCESEDTCELHKGANITFGVDFTATADNDHLKMLVYGHVAGVDVPFPIDNPDACKNSGITCPVTNGKPYSYRSVIFVKTEYPSISVVVKLKLVNAAGDILVCVVIPVKIEAKIESRASNSVLRFQPRP